MEKRATFIQCCSIIKTEKNWGKESAKKKKGDTRTYRNALNSMAQKCLETVLELLLFSASNLGSNFNFDCDYSLFCSAIHGGDSPSHSTASVSTMLRFTFDCAFIFHQTKIHSFHVELKLFFCFLSLIDRLYLLDSWRGWEKANEKKSSEHFVLFFY